MTKEDVIRVDADSCGELEQVRKGKPRKFVMVCRGISIVSLIVYKKGSFEKYRKQAKEAGIGQVYFGVITGRGPNINFKLARSDGFDKEPVKTPILKSFLLDNADYKCKPLFEIVDAPEIVLDDDDPMVQRFMKLQENALEACDAHPDKAGEINTLCRQIGSHFDQDQADKAKDRLTTLETLLAGLGGGAPTKPESDAAAAFTARLKALKPEIKAALANPNATPVIKRKVSEAGVFARKQDFAQAGKLLDEVKALLNTVSPVAPPTTPVRTRGDAAAFTARLKALKPRIDAAFATPNADADMKRRVNQVGTFARKKDFAQANKLLDEVEALLRTATATLDSGVTKGLSLVKLGKARLEWADLRSQAVGELQRLKEILQDEYQDDEDEQTALTEAFRRLDASISELNEELGDQLDDLLNAQDAERPKQAATVKKTLDRYVRFVETDELMRVIDGNEYAPDMLIAAPMRAKLQEIAAALE